MRPVGETVLRRTDLATRLDGATVQRVPVAALVSTETGQERLKVIQPNMTTIDDLGTSWQTRGKWSQNPVGEGHTVVCSGYGEISSDRIQPWHVDASQTGDEGFTGTMSFPMVRPGRTLFDDQRCGADRGFGLMGIDHCSPTVWASLWSKIPGASVRCPGATLLDWDELESVLSRNTYLRAREYAMALTPAEAAEVKANRDRLEQERYEREMEREREYETPVFDSKVTWKGQVYDSPSMGDLREWASDSVCDTPDGRQVEPDHPDSWLSIMGMI